MKTKEVIIEEIKNSLRENIIRKELAFAYFKQATGNMNYFQSAMAAENEVKELKKQLDFFENYKENENLGSNGVGAERKIPNEDIK